MKKYWWEENTYKQKLQLSNKKLLKEEIPLLIIITLIYYSIFCDEIMFKDIFILSFITMIWILSTVNLFRQPPAVFIPDNYTKEGKLYIYIASWLLISFGFLIIIFHLYEKYYLSSFHLLE